MTNEANNQHTVAPLQPGNNAVHEQQVNDGRVDVSTLSTSQDGINFIKDYEQLSLTAYDTDGANSCTIGYGILLGSTPCSNITGSESFRRMNETDVYTKGVTKGEILHGMTQERADQLFDERLVEAENTVKRQTTVRVSQHEFDALVLFVFNAGHLYPHQRQNLNAGQYPDAAREFLNVTNHGLPGLVTRRNAEVNMFNNNVYDSRH